MIRILVVEDDANLRKVIAKFLIQEGYTISEAKNGQAALALFELTPFNLLITDIMMPVVDGLMLTNQIRSRDLNIPILMLTALEDYQNRERGYLCGVDDYMVKPIHLKEMGLRIKALLKRYQIAQESKIVFEHISLDEKKLQCVVKGELVELTTKEFKLLFKLLSYPNTIFTREQLMNDIWGFDSESYDRTVDTHIKRIREQVSPDDFEIITVRGLGYKAVLK